MSTGRKILVPVDFSEDSANGLKFAVAVAQKTDAEVVVLHVAQKEEADSFLNVVAAMEGAPMLNESASIPVDELLGEKALDLYNFIEKVIRNPCRVKISRRVAFGIRAEKILETVNKELIGLVVLSFRKQPLFRYLLARARFLRVIMRMPCPVLLTPPFDDERPRFTMARFSLFAG
ncbi:MAG TPA: universal stress protein [Candidatus Binatia bacterium]